MSCLLTDLMLLENQVPFLLLTILSTELIRSGEQQERSGEQQERASLVAFSQDRELSPKKLAESFFGCNVASDDFQTFVISFISSIPRHTQQTSTPTASLRQKAPSLCNINEPGTVASALREFMDKFKFKIEFNETQRELIIPTLHIKEETEIRWRNFIAWEQIGGLIGVGYKFTSYAHFFKGLVCSVHDIQQLKEKEVIRVHTEAKDEDLLIMFQSIVTGAKLMDGR